MVVHYSITFLIARRYATEEVMEGYAVMQELTASG
jgi:hypothetical protein